MPHRPEPRGTVHAETHIPHLASLRLPPMQPHPHPQAHLLGPNVRCQLTLTSITADTASRAEEGEEERSPCVSTS